MRIVVVGPRGAWGEHRLRVGGRRGGGVRGVQRGESAGSRRRFARWLASASHVWGWGSYAVTLTQPGDVPVRQMHEFFRSWCQGRRGRAVIWRLEVQKRGAWHVHAVVWDDGFDWEEFRGRWCGWVRGSVDGQAVGVADGRWSCYLSHVMKRSQSWTRGRWWGVRGREFLVVDVRRGDDSVVEKVKKKVCGEWRGGVVFGDFR